MLIGACATILGNIHIGKGAQVSMSALPVAASPPAPPPSVQSTLASTGCTAEQLIARQPATTICVSVPLTVITSCTC